MKEAGRRMLQLNLGIKEVTSLLNWIIVLEYSGRIFPRLWVLFTR